MRIAARVLSTCAALTMSACAVSPAPAAAPPPMIVGGYVAADLNEPGVKAAQAVAVNEIYTQRPTRALVEKVGAEMQVVAGLNYRFTISMSGGASYRVVVYRNLQGEMSVSSLDRLS